ncbi:NAD(P)/FAD-dependent oxidoreductase [Mycolicibacterium helvum]|uniref:Oxidoreductase n=1 Tax=Mycolicibacterium helvum TaxID=1534349 RepID=A0A7I7SY07_9MYCO|nr:FAD-dependent oxidoreductase [Mycolicibacterium helvum]BBY61907.1 oxidoreductase [Mycolicibacterium helvum]
MTAGVVIIGGGQGGFETAIRLRANGFQMPVTLISDEDEVPYQRPPLSKSCLVDGLDRDLLRLRPARYFPDHDITLIRGVAATAIDRPRQRVLLSDRSHLPYDHLVLALGARNRILPVVGAGATGVHYLRTVADADGLQADLGRCASIAIIGAGFIGLEVAAAARKRGLSVTVIESLARPMARAVSPIVSDYFLKQHAAHGVRLATRTGVDTILTERGTVTGIRTTIGEDIHAEAVVVGIGVIPNTELAEEAGLPTQNGVIVDRQLRTVDQRIFAIGDCAAFPARSGSELVRLESVQNAVDHARCVAAQLTTGPDMRYQDIPWFWSQQYSYKLQIAGLTSAASDFVLRGSFESGSFSVFCYQQESLLGVESVNAPHDHLAARKILAAGMLLTREQSADTGFDLKSAVKGLAPATAG